MRIKGMLLSLALAVAGPAMAQSAPVATISGNYVEFRNADVYTGPCFANSEMGLTGQEAVLGWQVAQGSWAGVPLDGLAVVAVVRASATLGDPFENPLPAKTVFIVDARASQVQRAALIQFAQAQTSGLLNDVVAVQAAPIAFSAPAGGHGDASLQAGNLLRLATRPIGSGDEICHNEEVYYQPLATHLSHAVPAVALDSTYTGNHLGITWSESGRRSAFVGSFAF
jgi:hypothetical protein